MKAIFLGKFQPPHLGHVRTILKLARQYDQVIVGITKGEPKIEEYEEVKLIFDEVFYAHKNIYVTVIDGTIEGGTSDIANLDFDIVVSGNQKVLDILKSKGFQTKMQSRSKGFGYSGSELRALIEKQKVIGVEHRENGYEFKIVPTSLLKPLERIYPSHFKNIEKLILKEV